MQYLILTVMTLIVAEFGIHVVYHAITGKAGLYDPPFEYLIDIARRLHFDCIDKRK
jgi:hypothetical protein